jgi:hypothetical protein
MTTNSHQPVNMCCSCCLYSVGRSDEESHDPYDTLKGLSSSSSSSLPVGAGDPNGSIFDMQLPVAGLQLLAGLLARSSTAMDWFRGQEDR